MRRGLIALLLAFGWLFSTPAHATPLVTGDRIQFSYTWGSVTQTFTDSLVTVTVTNNITNKIGYGGEVIDTYRITFGDQVIEVTEKHGPRDYNFLVSGSATITLEGIDRGFWAGYYGPIMVVSVSPIVQPEEPTTQSPEVATESPTASPTEAPTVTQSPEPEVQPTPTPLPEPSPTPTYQPEPTPEPTPSETPTASFPTQSPEPEPTRSPIVEVEPESASESAAPTTSPTLPPIQPEPQPSQTIEPTPVQSSEAISEEPSTTTAQIIEVAEETFAGSLSAAVQAAIGEAVKAVGQLVEAFASAGLDMTPEQREEAQDLVVSTVITSQVAAGIRKIK